MEDRLLGPRAGEKIRDMLIKQNPGTAIQQIKDRHGLNHNNLNNIIPFAHCMFNNCWFSFLFRHMFSMDVGFSACLFARIGVISSGECFYSTLHF